MQNGAKNRRIAIWRPRNVADGAGGQEQRWDFVGYRRVKARPSGGSQVDVSNMLTNQQGWRIEMRRMAVEAGWRVVLDDVNYRVRAAFDPDGRRRDVVLLVDMEINE